MLELLCPRAKGRIYSISAMLTFINSIKMKNKNTFGIGNNAQPGGERAPVKLQKLVGRHNLSAEREAAQIAIASFNIQECQFHENDF